MPISDDRPASTASSTSTSKSDLQGANQLVIDAITSITRIVESLHHRISRVSAVTGNPSEEHASGLTGMVYQGIRSIAELVGSAIDVPLGIINTAVTNKPGTAATKGLRAVLNGILGDYLLARNNPLKIDMHFSAQEQPFGAEALSAYIQQAITQTNGKLLIMVHGLCMNDVKWTHKEHNHGELLATQLGYTPLYLNYNSGLNISQNGQRFSALLETITRHAGADLNICVLAHSMGGLVTRSACHYAAKNTCMWPQSLQKIVFLGTPHHGAPLEKTGNWLDLLLGVHPYTVPFARLIQVRSAGITDLRYGNVTDEDWQADRFDFSKDLRTPTPLPLDTQCYAIAASIYAKDKTIYDRLLGDGLVTLNSALGKHDNEAFTLLFKPEQQLHVPAINHMELLSDDTTYKQLLVWLVID